MIRELFKRNKNHPKDTASPQEALCNVKKFGNHLICNGTHEKDRSIFTFIKLLSDKISLDSTLDMIAVKEYEMSDIDGFFYELEDSRYLYNTLYRKIRRIQHTTCDQYDLHISLSRDPVITFPRERIRLVKCFRDIGEPIQKWTEDELNHEAALYLPMGLTHIYRGNHSSYTGILKGEGSIHIHPCSSHSVHDISPLYDLIQFDGENFVKAGTNIVVGKPYSFEHGCIFELGRLIAEKNIEFTERI